MATARGDEPPRPEGGQKESRPGGWKWLRAALITGVLAVALLEGRPWPSERWNHWSEAVVAPLRPVLLEPLRFRQRWRFFRRPHAHPKQVDISLRRGDDRAWEPIHRRGVAELDWSGERLDYTRIRYLLTPKDTAYRRRLYRQAVSWLAGEVFDDHPGATEVRVVIRRLAVGRPGAPPALGAEEMVETRTRAQVDAWERRARTQRGRTRRGGL